MTREQKCEWCKTVEVDIYLFWKDQPILHDEDEWHGRYKTWGEMWKGEGYEINDNTFSPA